MSRARVVLGVCLAWVIIAFIASAQASIGSALMPAPNVPTPSVLVTLRTALIALLPWIPVTLGAIALTQRYPLSGGGWRRHIAVHVLAALLLGVLANTIVVLTYWSVTGQAGGLGKLARAAVLWTAVRLYLVAIVYGAAAAISETVRYHQRARARELELAQIEAQLARAHVQALNAQIRPHFLFNTLHTIGQLWRSGNSGEADAVLDHLGDLFHKVHASTSQLTVALREELAIVRDYLAIEEVRYRDRLHTEVTVQDEVLDCPVPPLILQPIVENAVRHGISAVSSAGRLIVSAERVGNRLHLVVHDDGPGPVDRAAPVGSGTGLRNTRERLARMYGNDAELRIESETGNGTTARITIPISATDATA